MILGEAPYFKKAVRQTVQGCLHGGRLNRAVPSEERYCRPKS